MASSLDLLPTTATPRATIDLTSSSGGDIESTLFYVRGFTLTSFALADVPADVIQLLSHVHQPSGVIVCTTTFSSTKILGVTYPTAVAAQEAATHLHGLIYNDKIMLDVVTRPKRERSPTTAVTSITSSQGVASQEKTSEPPTKKRRVDAAFDAVRELTIADLAPLPDELRRGFVGIGSAEIAYKRLSAPASVSVPVSLPPQHLNPQRFAPPLPQPANRSPLSPPPAPTAAQILKSTPAFALDGPLIPTSKGLEKGHK